MKSHKNKYLTFKTQDLVATTMLLKNRKHITIDEIFALCVKLHHKIEEEGAIGKVSFGNANIEEFAREHSKQFYVGENVITLKKGYNIDWLIENITSCLSADQLSFLGLINLKQNNNTLTSV